MPVFSFTKAPKRKVNNKPFRVKTGISIIDKNIKGYVIINKDLDYLVQVDNDDIYLIHKSSYKCKGKQVIYSQLLVGPFKQRLVIHRIPDYCINHRPYLPFSVGCIVIGDIIIDNIDNGKYFKIKKCFVDNDDPKAYKITKEFRESYNDELEQKIIQKYTNDTI